MAMQPPLANDKKRVKVYELRDNDWFDRGTGFCTGQVINVSICAWTVETRQQLSMATALPTQIAR